MTNPVLDFLKYAEQAEQVRAHTRIENGKTVPVKAYARSAEEEAALTEKKSRELEYWQAWKDSGNNPELLKPLITSFNPMLQSKVNVYKGKVKMIPDSAIETEFQLRFVDALRSYEPSKGSLGTYVFRYLDKAKRFIVENQNVGRIPENRVYKIKQFTSVRDDLQEELGRPVTDDEMAGRLGWGTEEVKRMGSELRSDFLSQGFEEGDPYALTPSKSEEVLKLFKYDLEGQEREVYEYLTGYGRPHLTSTSDIAKAMKLPDYQVSRTKNAIQKKLQGYLYG